MSNVKNLEVSADDDGIRVDRWFKSHFPELTHGRLEKLLRTGQVRVDGGRVKANLRLTQGQTVRVPPFPAPTAKSASRGAKPHPRVSQDDRDELQGRVLYKDDDVLVINKPAGLAVQGGSKTSRHLDGMLDALQFRAKERPRLVHRLDKDTSGVLVLARNAPTARVLTEAFRTREVEKLYWAVVAGVPRPEIGIIDLPLLKSGGAGGEKMTADDSGKKAVTQFRVIERAASRAAWLALEPLTGRTHQLRVHCAEIGTPIVGDGKYGGPDAFLTGGNISAKIHLHARAIHFSPPGGGRIDVFAPLPDHMYDTFSFLGFDPSLAADADVSFSQLEV